MKFDLIDILTPVNDKAFCEGPKVASEIYISITKSGKPELVTQKLTELGVGLISFFPKVSLNGMLKD